MRIIFICVAGLSLLGCETTPEQAAQDDAYCQSLSAQPGTDAYVNCRFVLDQRRKSAQNKAAEAWGQALGAALAQ
jgi:hypothetical protein